MNKKLGILVLAFVLVFSIAVSVSAGFWGFGGSDEEEQIDTKTTNKIVAEATKGQEHKEAPTLSQKVVDGELPKVDERLPENPKVIEVRDEIGEYGGTLNLIKINEMRALQIEHTLETYPSPGFEESKMEGNIIEEWKSSDDAREFTFTIRKGLKWSDGVPVTTEDVRFTFEDIYSNKNVQLSFPSWLSNGGEKVDLEVIDDYTFKLSFKEPYGLFLLQLQSVAHGSYHQLINPAHHLKQFHAKYRSMNELKPYLEDEQLSEKDWGELFRRKWQSSPWNQKKDIGYPTLAPYVVAEKPADNVTILERNPYYHKVDEQGNQFPYIDRVRFEEINNQEMINMKIIAGEIDFTINTSLGDLALYKENEGNGDYRTLLEPMKSINSKAVYFPNLTYDDPAWREILGDVKFRQALSLGINRDEINELVFYGMGEPSQAADAPGSPFSKLAYREAYIEYNPAKANRLLDEMGLEERNEEGWRIGPNGKVLTLNIEFFEVNPSLTPTTELVVSYWKQLGIKTDMKVIDGALWYQRQGANDTRMSVWHEDASRPGSPFFFFVPYERINWAPAWQKWYTTDGQEGEEPPAEVKELFANYEKFIKTSSEEERVRLGQEILKSQAENLWVIGTVSKIPVPVIVQNNLRNVKGGVDPQWGPAMGEQYFFTN